MLLSLYKPVSADWLALCDQKPDPSSIESAERYFKADGGSYWLMLLSEADDRCHSRLLDVDAGDISWIGLISTEKSARINQRVILQGDFNEKKIRVSEVIADRPEARFELDTTLGVARNLVDDFFIRTFGVEERAQASVDQHTLKLHCRAGQKPAGILLDVGNRKLSSNHRLELSVSYSSEHDFQLGIADDDRFNRGDPVMFHLPAATLTQVLALPYAKLDMSQDVHWSLVCPQKQAAISISKFELLLTGNRGPVTNRDMWIWRADSWRLQPERLFDLLSKYNAGRVFISVEMDEAEQKIRHAEALHAFIVEAGRRAIAVWAVEGDPHATLPGGQEQFVRRAKILQQYNRASAEDARIKGVQYDIEPYLVKGWSLDQPQWFVAYVETLGRINRELTLPIEIAIPFWWQFKSLNNESLLNAVAPHIDSVNVMNYRTDVELIKQFAQPLLDWGLRANKKVSIALEAGPVPDEPRWHFRKNRQGRLLHLKDFPQPVLILLDMDINSDVADTFSLYRKGVLEGNSVSFQKDPASLIGLLPELEFLWSQWPSFAGISLHGFESELY